MSCHIPKTNGKKCGQLLRESLGFFQTKQKTTADVLLQPRKTSTMHCLNVLQTMELAISSYKIISLDYEFEEETQFSIVWVTGSFLSALWQLRVEKKRVDLVKIRSEMEANCRLLRESRLEKTTEILAQIFSYLYN